MKPKPIPLKRKINAATLTFIGMLKEGDQIRTEDVIKYVHKYVHKYIYGDTILRYLRELRENGKLDYEIKDRRSRIMTIREINT